MAKRRSLTLALAATLLAATVAQSQQPSSKQLAQERAQAELDAPKLAEVLELKPGMTVADVGAGGGAMTVVLGKWIGTGHVFATDIDVRALATIRDDVKREGLNNVTVIEGAPASTNLPAACGDAIFLRHVYHHIADRSIQQDPANSAEARRTTGGYRLRAEGRIGTTSKSVCQSRRPRCAPAVVISEVSSHGLAHAITIDAWPPGDNDPSYFLVLFRK